MTLGRWLLAAVLSLLVHVAVVGILFFVGSQKVVVGFPQVYNVRVYQVKILRGSPKSVRKAVKKAELKAEKPVKKPVPKESKPKYVPNRKSTPPEKSEVLYKRKVKKKAAKKRVSNKEAKRKVSKVSKKKSRKSKELEHRVLEQRIRELEQERYLEKRLEELRREVMSSASANAKYSVVSKASGKEIALSRSSAKLDPLLVLYLSRLMDKIRMNWALPEGVVGKEAVISVRIARNGALAAISVEKGSGDPMFDGSCLRAVRRSFPFVPLPQVYRGDYLEIGVRFKR